MRIAFAYLLVALSARAAEWTWPSGNLTGPYTLASSISNVTVFTPNSSPSVEIDLATHKYQHHTRIAYAGGLTYIAFSSACTNEQDAGMQTAFCVSSNHGGTWSAPVLACPSQSQWQSNWNVVGSRIAYPRNWQIYSNDLYLISAVDQFQTYSNTSLKTQVVAVALVAVKAVGASVSGNPFLVSTDAYTAIDGKTQLSYNATLGPPLLAGSQIYGCWGGSYTPAGFTNTAWVGWLTTNGIFYDEPNTFYADSGTNNLYRLWRKANGTTTVVAYNSSVDGGLNWSAPVDTAIPHSPSETAGLRLADGRYAVIGNPQTGSTYRDPLFLAVTDTGTTPLTNIFAVRQGLSATPIYAGFSKSGGASYVHAIQVSNYLYVSYSMQKESIGFSRVLIPDLADNNNDLPVVINISASSATAGTLRSAP